MGEGLQILAWLGGGVAGRGMAWLGKAQHTAGRNPRCSWAWRGVAGRGTARQGMASHIAFLRERKREAGPGMARQGVARPGWARRGYTHSIPSGVLKRG